MFVDGAFHDSVTLPAKDVDALREMIITIKNKTYGEKSFRLSIRPHY